MQLGAMLAAFNAFAHGPPLGPWPGGDGSVPEPPDAADSPSILLALGKMIFPLIVYLAIAPVLWKFFRDTWKELDRDANEARRATIDAGKYDFRPAVLFTITAIVLLWQEYYGSHRFFGEYIRPALRELEAASTGDPSSWGRFVHLKKYGELYGYAWWSFTRVFGYVAVPLVAWKIIFRNDSLLDMGLRVRGFLSHAWIYGLCLAVVLPLVFVVSRSPDFANYYPFYKKCSRSWFDLICWEGMYFAQFFGLEVFFRGFWLSGLRKTLGSGAIFAMCVPYCMIHFQKPYFEACGAVIAGIALGSLAMRTKSIYSGFLVHVTVALSMDLLAVAQKHGLPHSFWG